MRLFKHFFGLLIVLLLLLSCEDDSGSTPIVGSIFPPTVQEYSELQFQALNNLTQNFLLTVDDSGYIEFTSEQGVEVSIPTFCLYFNGEEVAEGDELGVEFVELYNKGNLLSTGIATMGRDSNGNLKMLVTGGAFYLNITKNGQQPDEMLCMYNMNVPVSNTGEADEDMILWFGNFDENGNLVWDETVAEQEEGDVWIEGEEYQVWASQFGWTNIDRFYNDDSPKTTIQVDVPEGYTPENCSVYLAYVGELGLARLDTYDEETGYFSEHYGQIPIGLECHVIFVSEHNGQWVYVIKTVTIEENEIIEILHSELATVSETGLTNLINNLP